MEFYAVRVGNRYVNSRKAICSVIMDKGSLSLSLCDEAISHSEDSCRDNARRAARAFPEETVTFCKFMLIDEELIKE